MSKPTSIRLIQAVVAALGIVWGLVFALYILKYWTILGAGFPSKIFVATILAGILMLSTATLVARESVRANLLLTLCGTMVAIYVLEIAHYSLTYYPGFPQLSPPVTINQATIKAANAQGIWVDKRSKIEVLRDLRTRGIDAYPAFLVTNRSSWDTDLSYFKNNPLPLGSISHSTIVHCNESGKWSIYESDEKGFNNPEGSWGRQDYTALLLGDSFVHGACVDPDEDFGSVMRETYPGIMNLGQRGNGPLLQLAGIREYGVRLKPRFVFWMYTENNDLDNLRGEIKSPFLRQYLSSEFSQGLYDRQGEIDKFVNHFTDYNYKLVAKNLSPSFVDHMMFVVALRSIRKRFGLEVVRRGNNSTSEWKVLQGLKLVKEKGPTNIDPTVSSAPDPNTEEMLLSWWSAEIENYERVLRAAKLEVESWGGELVFVYLPDGGSYHERKSIVYETRDPMLKVVGELNIEVLDGDEVIGVGDYKKYFPPNGGHYNALGYKMIGQQMIDFIVLRGIPK